MTQSTSSQSGQGQQDISSTAAQPSESLAMSNEAVLTEAMLYESLDMEISDEAVLTEVMQFESQTMSNEMSNEAVLAEAMPLASTLSTTDSAAVCESLATSNEAICSDAHSSSDIHQDSNQSDIDSKDLSLHHVSSTPQKTVTKTNKSGDHNLGVRKPLPGNASLEMSGSLYGSSTINSGNCSSSDFDQDSVPSVDSEHLSLHQKASTDQCMHTSRSNNYDDCSHSTCDPAEKKLLCGDASLELNHSRSINNDCSNYNDYKSLPGDAPLGMNSSFYSSKISDKDDCYSSDFHQTSTQSTAVDCNCEQQSPHQVESTAQYVHSSSNCDDLSSCDLEEKNRLPVDVSIEMNGSFYNSMTNNSNDPSSSDLCQDNAQPADLEDLSPSTDECMHSSSRSSNCDDHNTCDLDKENLQPGDVSMELNNSSDFHQDSIQTADHKHLSPQEGASTTQCTYDCDDHSTCDLDMQPGDAFPRMNDSLYSSRRSETDDHSSSDDYQNSTPSTDHDHLSPHQEASISECMHSNSDCDDHSTCDMDEKNPQLECTSLEMNGSPYNSEAINSDDCSSSDLHQDNSQPADHKCLSPHQVGSTDQCMHTSSRSSNFDDLSTYDLGEEKTLPGDAPLELRSSSDLASHDSDEQNLVPNGSVFSSTISTSNDCSSSDVHQKSTQLTHHEHLSPHQVKPTTQYVHSNSNCDGNSSCVLGGEKSLPIDASIEMNGSFYSSRTNISDDRFSLDFRQDSTQSADSEHLSLHQVASTAQYMHSSSKSSNYDDQSTCDLGEENLQPGDVSMELNNSSDFHQDSIQPADHEHLSPQEVVSTTQCTYDYDDHSTCDLDMQPGEEMNGPLYSSRRSETDDHSSSDDYQNSTPSTDCEHLSPHQEASISECMHSSSNCDDHRACDLGEIKALPGDTSPKVNRSSNFYRDCTGLQSSSIYDDQGTSDLEKSLPGHVSTELNYSRSINSNDCSSYDLVVRKLLPGDAYLEMNSSFYSSSMRISDASDFYQDSSQSTDCEHMSLHQIAPTTPRIHSSFRLSPVASIVSIDDEVRIVKELDNKEFPHYYDKESTDAVIVTETSHCTIQTPLDTSAECSIALPGNSSEHLSQSGKESMQSAEYYQVMSSGSEHIDSVHKDKDPMDGTSPLKTSSSASLPEVQDDNYSLNTPQRHDSTVTSCNILGQLTESSASEGEQKTTLRQDITDCEHLGLHPVASPLAPRIHSGLQLSPVGSLVFSDNEVCNVKELENEDFPNCYDKELADAVIVTETSHCTIPSSEHLSQNSNEKLQSTEHSPIISCSSGSEHKDSVPIDMDLMDGTNIPKMSSSASLPEVQNNNYSLNTPQRHNSTVTSCNILGQLTESNTSEGEQMFALHHDSIQSTDCEHLGLASPLAPRIHSGLQLSPVGSVLSSDDEVCIVMELENEENQYSGYKESTVTVTESVHYTNGNTSTEYFTAPSDRENMHRDGQSPGPVMQLFNSSDSEHKDSAHLDMDPMDGTSPLKTSSSTSLFIPRGLSSGPQDSNYSLNTPQRHNSTVTSCSILGQLTESEGEQRTTFCQDITQSSECDCEHLGLHPVASPLTPSIHSCLQLSPVGSVVSSDDEVCIVMELENEEFPNCCDKESIDDVNLHYTTGAPLNTSTEYFTASPSEINSGHLDQSNNENTDRDGRSPKPVMLTDSSGSEHKDSAHADMDPMDGTSLLKTSSSASLFIPRGLSSGPQDSNYSLNTPQRHNLTVTSYSILGQLTESGVSEGELVTTFHQDITQSSECDCELLGLHPVQSPLAPRIHSGLQLSPAGSVVSSDDEVRIVMELENEEFPDSGYKESTDAVTVTESLHYTDGNTSTEYFTAPSEISSGHLSQRGSGSTHSTGHSPVLSSGNSGSEHKDTVHLDMDLMDGTNLLKMSSSTSLFIPRGLSSGPQDSNYSLNTPQRHDSTTTFYSILEQYSESSASEGERRIVDPLPDQPPPIYEPY